MPGHVVRLATVAGSAAAALLLSVNGAAACGTCGCGHYQSYAVAMPSVGYAVQASCGAAVYQPHVDYKPHVVYSPHVVYQPGYSVQPAYRVQQGPVYTAPVQTVEEPAPEYGRPKTYPYVGHSRSYRSSYVEEEEAPRPTYHRPYRVEKYRPYEPTVVHHHDYRHSGPHVVVPKYTRVNPYMDPRYLPAKKVPLDPAHK